MRVFTPDEQELLRRISNGQGRNLYNLIDSWIGGVSFQVNTATNNIVFIFEQTPGLNLVERLNQIQAIVIQAVNLIKLFEDRGYIFTFVNANQLPPNPFIFGQAAVNMPSIPYHFPDPRISQMFAEYSTKEIFVTPELQKFISDGFITREEVRANRQFRITRNAFIVAIIALLVNITINIGKGTSKDMADNDKCICNHKQKCDLCNNINAVKNDTSQNGKAKQNSGH